MFGLLKIKLQYQVYHMKIARYKTRDIMVAIHNCFPEPGMSHMQECHTILT